PRRPHDPQGAVRGHDVGRAAAQVRGGDGADGRGGRLRRGDRLPERGRLRGDRAARARARGLCARPARGARVGDRLRTVGGAEGQNPLCGDEVSIYVSFEAGSDIIDEVKFSGRGCAISQAATSMLMEMVQGRAASEVASLTKDDLVEELGIPLTPVRLKCAILGLTTLQLA